MSKWTGSRRNDTNTNLRLVLAQEAARLIRDHGIENFHTAKLKAADKLGFNNYGALPSNTEIEQALAEHNRIFGQDKHVALLASLRKAAVLVMHDLHMFRPCLVGSVLSGNVTEHSSIDLHVFCDAAELVGMQLTTCGFRHTATSRRYRMRREQVEAYPGYQFYVEDCGVEVTVFLERRKGHAPLCPVSGRPMARVGVRDVELLVGG
jgi:hypothetical protein